MAKSSRGKNTSTQTIHDAFIMELRDMYDAEHQILKALPKMAKKAHSAELKRGFEEHEKQTKEQVKRLEEVFAYLDETPKKKKCAGMQGIIEEGTELMKQKIEESAMDAALAAAAQKVEHYEISSYGTLCAWAKAMGHDKALELLKQNMSEEEETDEKLTNLAESELNPAAREHGEDMGMHADMREREKDRAESEMVAI